MPLLPAPSSPTLTFNHFSSQLKAAKNCWRLCNSRFLSQRHSRHFNVPSAHSILTPKAASLKASASVSDQTSEDNVLKALAQIIDPDFGTDIVSCGFVKDLHVDEVLGEVSFRVELTTPACPIKDMFEQTANEVVSALPWVKKVNVNMSAQPARPAFAGQLPPGLQTISNIVAVSSCKKIKGNTKEKVPVFDNVI